MEVEERKWENLASDCLVSIFCYVGLDDLTLALPFVCKSWNEASLDPRCWKKLDFAGILSGYNFRRKFEQRFEQQYGFKIMSKDLSSTSSFMKLCISRSCGLAAELSISDLGYATSLQHLIYASARCPRLKVLSFTSVLIEDEKHLPELISRWKELEILKIERKKPFSILGIFEQIRINCPNFIGLRLHGLFNIIEMKAIVRCMSRLKILDLSRSIICKEGLMEILDGCKELDVLNVSHCAGFDVDNDILMKASMINKFECEYTSKNNNVIHRFYSR